VFGGITPEELKSLGLTSSEETPPPPQWKPKNINCVRILLKDISQSNYELVLKHLNDLGVDYEEL